jgi:hypothetical protein
MRTGGILGSIWAVHLFPGAPGVHPLNLGHLHQHRVWFLHVTWICSSQREPTWHCEFVILCTRFGRGIIPLNMLCTMPYRRCKKTLFDQEKNGSVENEKYMFISLCGLTTGIVRFHYWDYSCHTLETTPFPSSPATVSAGLFQYWSQQRRQ